MKKFLLAAVLLLFLLEADAPPRASASGAVSVTRTRSFQASTTTDANFRDAYVDTRRNTFNYGASTTMNVKSSFLTTSCGSTNANQSCDHALIWFDVSVIPASLTMSAASVDLTATTADVTRTHGLYPITQSWTEGTGTGSATVDGATWNTTDGTTA